MVGTPVRKRLRVLACLEAAGTRGARVTSAWLCVAMFCDVWRVTSAERVMCIGGMVMRCYDGHACEREMACVDLSGSHR